MLNTDKNGFSGNCDRKFFNIWLWRNDRYLRKDDISHNYLNKTVKIFGQ